MRELQIGQIKVGKFGILASPLDEHVSNVVAVAMVEGVSHRYERSVRKWPSEGSRGDDMVGLLQYGSVL